tara:strand:+ start:7312 stop:7653 length:342 start_codon:yes stop_codon:yes gene_type:complete
MPYKDYYGDGTQITNGLIQRRVSDWKRQGIILREDETWDIIHDTYKNTTNCCACDKDFVMGRGTSTGQGINGKCLDHDHFTGYYRQILCRSCNTRDRFINIYTYNFIQSLNDY